MSIDKALQKLELINDGGLDFGSQELSSLFPLLEKCKRYGTEPFAILARHGFIAQTLMRSLVEINIITEEELSLFQASIRTIASELVDDMNTLQAGQLTVSKFMEDYGHLRPNTYDILSPRYDEMPEFFSYKSGKKNLK